jgi:hypothetical protein
MLQAMHTSFGWTNDRLVHAAVILVMRQRAQHAQRNDDHMGPIFEMHRRCRDNAAAVGRLQSRTTAPNCDPGIRQLSVLWYTNARSSARLRFASIARCRLGGSAEPLTR